MQDTQEGSTVVETEIRRFPPSPGWLILSIWYYAKTFTLITKLSKLAFFFFYLFQKKKVKRLES